MATESPVQEDQAEPVETVDAGRRRRLLSRGTPGPRRPVGEVLRELNWTWLLGIGIAGGVAWTLLLAQGNTLTFFAGLLPVAGGILLGRRVQSHVVWHAALLSAITVFAALVTTVLLAAAGAATPDFLAQVALLGVVALLPFPAFGVYTAHQSEQRNRLARQERERRGGKLDKPGRVKTIEDLRSLSLPQLGGYVADLFRKHDFLVKDFHFERDNYLEFDMTHDDEPWLIRVTVEEKVKQGAALQMVQKLRAEDIGKGVLITSMDFQDAALRWAKDKPVALIDGPTLLSMHD